ncbi:mitochondrial carrier homolog 2 [Drosophila albomicans]|uniref:Mitochondrial carrier homolog 2 n=1 Tax=Drosophila albomicans TaxID=7291 RepID=A0A6P8YGJ0_DROAB|nr:mitochondrial carrier homolog 2 [Drosophila albomicans]
MDTGMKLMYEEEETLLMSDAGNDEEMMHVSVAAAVMQLEALNNMQLNGELEPEAEVEGEVESKLQTGGKEWQPEKPSACVRFLLRMGFGAIMHPYEYAKVLMQLGHEPLPAVAATSWLGKSTLLLPSVHQYLRYIKHTDGFVGLYRGLGARFLSCAISAMFSESLVHVLGMSRTRQRRRKLHRRSNCFKEYAWNLMRDGIVVTTGLIFSHPFYVISVRQMAQFVGREVAYNDLRSSIHEILQHDGPLGFYAGFVPRLLCDLGVLFVTSTLSAACERLCVDRSSMRQMEYNSVLFQFGAVLLLYPLQVVGACMACSGSGIAAGAPPFMPVYGQWIDCLMDLFARGDHYRGAFIFRRTLPRLQMNRMHDAFPISRMI